MDTKQVIVITPEHEVSVQQMPIAKEYEFLNTAVAGWIQAVSLADDLEGITLWVNEEGKLDNLPYNQKATYLWEQSYGFTDVICGTAVLTGGSDDEGETLPLTDVQVAQILALLKQSNTEKILCQKWQGIFYAQSKSVFVSRQRFFIFSREQQKTL